MDHEKPVSRTIPLLWLAVVPAAALALVISCQIRPGTEFTIVFDDAKELTVGSKVVLQGKEIGKVTRVELTADNRISVEVWIPEDEKIVIPSNCTARIKDAALFNIMGKKIVELYIPEDQGAPIVKGTSIEGLNSWAEEQLWKAAQKAKAFLEKHRLEIQEGVDEVVEFTDALKGKISSPEVRDALEELRVMTEELTKEGVKTAQELKERMPELEAKVKEVWKKLKDAQHSEEAQKLKALLQDLKERIKALDEDPAPEPEPQ